MGGVRENEDWTLKTDTGEACACGWVTRTRTSRAWGSRSSDRRTAAASRRRRVRRSRHYKRLATADVVRLKPDTTGTATPSSESGSRPSSVVSGSLLRRECRAYAGKEAGFFDGIDTSIPGIFNAIRRPAPPTAAGLLSAIDVEIRAAVAAFSVQNPSASVPALARGLAATREDINALAGGASDAVFILQMKEQQFMDAINTALGIDFEAIAASGPVVPGQPVDVSSAFTNRGTVPIDITEMTLLTAAGGPDWRLPSNDAGRIRLGANQTARHTFAAATLPTARLSRPYFERGSIADARYTVGDPSQLFKPAATPSLRARAIYEVAGVPVYIDQSPFAVVSRTCLTGTSCAS